MRAKFVLYYVNGDTFVARRYDRWMECDQLTDACLFDSREEAHFALTALLAEAKERLSCSRPSEWWWDIGGGLVEVRVVRLALGDRDDA